MEGPVGAGFGCVGGDAGWPEEPTAPGGPRGRQLEPGTSGR